MNSIISFIVCIHIIILSSLLIWVLRLVGCRMLAPILYALQAIFDQAEAQRLHIHRTIHYKLFWN